MNRTDLASWWAATLTFGTVACRDMARMRTLVVPARLAFLRHGASAALLPLLVLHVVLPPLNLRRWGAPHWLSDGWLAQRPGRPTRPRSRHSMLVAAVLVLIICLPCSALALSPAQRAHAQAVESFRQGRFSEAYGRFVQLANAGHAPAARVALWMCEQGPDLFGKDWDCGTDEVVDWAGLTGVPAPRITGMSYPRQILTSRGWSVERGRVPATAQTPARDGAAAEAARPRPAR